MKEEQFNQLLKAVREGKPDDSVVAEAGERVWKAMTAVSPGTGQTPRALRSCEDFQALVPAYLARQLAPARALLLEDHFHGCVACRRVLERVRDGERQAGPNLASLPRNPQVAWRWAVAAMGCAALALGVFAFTIGVLPGQHAVRGSVASVDGSLYAVSGQQMHPVPAGYAIRNGDQIRTAKGSTAVVRLLDGSLVEMGERADLSVSRAWKGMTIHLDGGQVIIQAAPQHSGHLYVATDDCQVAVKGTIFSVHHGIKGSRVAVIEGVVQVDYGERTSELRAGEQSTSSGNVSQVPIRDEIAWSKNSAKYLALLGDFSILQKQLAAIPGPGLRYTSDLLPYVPEKTVVYAAIPNLANTLSQAGRIFQERLSQSPALRNWWRQQEKKGTGPKLEDVLDQLKTFSGYLGDEIVFAAGKTGFTYTEPVVLARVRQPGLESFVEKENRQLSSNPSLPALKVVRDPWALTPARGEPLLIYIDNNLLIASHGVAELQQAVVRARHTAGNPFAETQFYQQIVAAYQQGAEWLFCANMEQIVVQNVHSASGNALPLGIGDVRYLTMEHREVSGKPESRAVLTFASERQGVASWLAAPASMGSLEFVSPDASMVTAAVIKNPRSILEELFQSVAASDASFGQHQSEFEAKTGVNVLDDIAAPLGGEVAMAFDGPVLPTPRWKLIFEVYDPVTLQATIEKLVDNFNREGAEQGHSIHLTKRQIGSRTYFVVTDPNNPTNSEVDYTFVDSYLIVGPDAGTLARAIQTRQAGYTLTHSPAFQALLPSDGYINFSAIFYHNVGPVIGPIAEQLKSSVTLTPQQQQSMDALTANSAPGLIYAYGEPDRILVASNTGFMGFDLGTLLTMGDNGPFLPQMMLGEALRHPPKTQ